MKKNYYHILGVPSSATAAQIKAAYKRMALRFHPDKNPHNNQAEERFKQINEAYQVLSSPRRRAQFDLQQQQEQYRRQAEAYYHPRYHHTRPPAGFQERHYRQRPQKPARFSRRDVQIVLSVVLLVVVVVIGLKMGWGQLVAYRALEQARGAERQRQWKDAHAAYSRVLDYRPAQEEARVRRGALRLSYLNNPAGAIEDYTVALQGNETPPAAWYAARGKGYLLTHKYQAALRDLTNALDRDTAQTEAFLHRGMVHLQLEDNWAEAVDDLGHYLQGNPPDAPLIVQVLLYRAFAYIRMQELKKAWLDTVQAVEKDSTNAKAFYLQARIIRAQGNTRLGCILLAKSAALGFAVAAEEAAMLCGSKKKK